MQSLSIANGADGRIAILEGRTDQPILLFEPAGAEWWAAQMLFGSIALRGTDKGPVAKVWRKLAGAAAAEKPEHIDVRIVKVRNLPQLVTFKDGASLFGLYEASAEALGLQMFDAVRRARGLEPFAIEWWKRVTNGRSQ